MEVGTDQAAAAQQPSGEGGRNLAAAQPPRLCPCGSGGNSGERAAAGPRHKKKSEVRKNWIKNRVRLWLEERPEGGAGVASVGPLTYSGIE
jgi:hypothetical protein